MVFSVDAKVYAVESLNDVRTLRLVGGGGTDMRKAFTQAQTMRPRPSILVVATDGYTPWPDDNPLVGTTTIVLLVGTGAQEDSVPSWARVIRVD